MAYANQQAEKLPIPLDKALCIVKDAFNGVSERDIYTGDFLEIYIIKQDGITIEQHPLRKD